MLSFAISSLFEFQHLYINCFIYYQLIVILTSKSIYSYFEEQRERNNQTRYKKNNNGDIQVQIQPYYQNLIKTKFPFLKMVLPK